LRIELHLDDCITGMAGLPAGSIDMGLTSPPFNLGTLIQLMTTAATGLLI